MFSESSQAVKSFADDLSRSRRLADVMKGTAYTRTVDNLAERQWNARGGLRMSTRTLLAPQLHVSSSYPQQRPGNTVLATLSSSPLKESSDDEVNDSYYNTWGSRCSNLDKKLQPRTRPRVVQPKRGVMMSRVSRIGQDRQIKTMRNFRSQNGTIRIIEPINPQPSFLHSERGNYDSNEDPVFLEHEQTSIVLKRIDEILHPAKVFFKSDLSSSEIEILSGESIPSIRSGKRERSQRELPLLSGHTGEPRSQSWDKRMSGMNGHSLALVIKRLAKRELDAYQKCQIWIDRCPAM